MKLKGIIVSVIVLFFSIIGFFQLKSYGYFETPNSKIGSTTGNIYNGGNASEDKDYIYYSNYDANGELHKMNKKTKKITKICDDVARYINVLDGYVYYSNLKDGEKIYKIKINGEGREKLGNSSAEYIRVRGEYIYYSNVDDDNSLYKMSIYGKKNRKILNENVHLFNIVDDKIYYLKKDALYSASINGNFKKRIYKPNKLIDYVSLKEDIQIQGDSIYFSNKGNESKNKFLCKADMKNFKVERLTDENVKDINIYGEYIYYINEFDGDSLYAIKIDGSNRKKIKEGPISNINIVGDHIFCFKDVHNEIYKMNILNGEKQKISKSSPSSAYIHNNNIIYTTDIKKNKRRGNLNIIDVNGKREKMLSYVEDGWQKITSIDKQWIYFTENIEKEDKVTKKFFRAKLDGSKEQEIIKNLGDFNGKVKDDYLYTVENINNNGFTLFKQKIGTNKKEKIWENTDESLKRLYSGANITINELTKDWIYYSINYEIKDSKISSDLYRCKLNGETNELVSKDNITNLLEYDGSLYYSTLSEKGTLYRMNLDGDKKNKVLDGKIDNVYLLTIKDGWIYYKSGKDGNRLYKININGQDKQRIFNDRNIDFIGVEGDYIYYEYALKNGKQFIIKSNEI
ncbi:DUF5050 domain-containing protein [Clostridium brassicae]|uniref:DUF5050 domain-containing protein n=1 Tax=Clostridium brassicae TaxID=2999072 RepID=A0ABT4DCR9_9CLOT|nr:DUF5050 domain-containing protein [Clostridium brassicae]MCY6960082.1 DUF5050 domain-containing protein [Clostridium brassicae]